MVRFNRAGIGFLYCLVLSSGSPALDWRPDDNGWTLTRRSGDVDIYRRPVDGSVFPALLAHARIEASADSIYAVISDYDRFREFVPSVLDSRTLERRGHTSWVYQRLGFPLMVADRHYVIKVDDTLDQADAGYIRVEWRLDRTRSRSLPAGWAVLPESFSGSWQLSALQQDRLTAATYSIHVDPGGMLPAWLYAEAAENYVFSVIQAVRQAVAARDENPNRHTR